MPAQHHRSLVSEDEFLSLPETTNKVELLDGEVIVSPSPTYWHQEILMRIVFALRRWGEDHPGVTICMAPLDVRFGPNKILQPDAFVILERLPLEQTGPIERIPELCVEVLSADRVYDRVTKRMVYAKAGVVEYWVVEHAGIIERWSGEELSVSQELRDVLTTPLLGGFELDVERLFAEL